MPQRSRAGYVFALAVGLLCWSVVPVFIRYLNENGVGNFPQNLYRYIPACSLLWILTLLFFRRHLAIGGRALLYLLGPTAVMSGHQLLWVQAIKMTTPTTAILLTQFQVVIVGLLAWIFFHDERSTIRSPRFLVGALLAVVGVVGFIIASGRDLAGGPTGYLFVLLTAVIWGVYTVVAKAAIKGLHPVVAFTYVSTGVLCFFMVTTPCLGNPGDVVKFPARALAALVISGIVGIALAHLFFYTALKGLGAAVCGASILVLPFLTGTWSYIVDGETLTPIQIVFGAVLLFGASLTLGRNSPKGKLAVPTPDVPDSENPRPETIENTDKTV